MFTPCGSACPPTCDSSNVACTFNCVPGCFCPSGMVDHNGTCIDPLQCPNAQGKFNTNISLLQLCMSCCKHVQCFAVANHKQNTIVDTQCSGGKVYTDCGSACPTTCETYGRELSCPAVCVSGCFCPVGTVDNHGTCIDPMQCSNASGILVIPGTNYTILTLMQVRSALEVRSTVTVDQLAQSLVRTGKASWCAHKFAWLAASVQLEQWIIMELA